MEPTGPAANATTSPAPSKPHFDDISNNLDTSVDAVAEVMSLNVGGTPGTTQLYLIEQNGDGKNGCNLTGQTTLGLSVSSSDESVATVSPSSVTFTSCGFTQVLTVTPHNQGSATVSITQTSNNTGATFNLAPATFAVNVTAAANTAPKVSITGVTGGATYNKGSVPPATCQVTDAEDVPASFAATLSAITGPYASDGIGSQTASCSYTDAGGLTASASVTYGIVDPSAPEIQYTLNPTSPDGSNGWYKSGVTLTWTVTEGESPNSLVKTGCVDQNITTDQNETTYSCSATSAGGSATQVDVKIKRDATAPTIAASASPSANTNDWNKTDVTVSFTCSDVTSGILTCPQDVVLSSEGADQSASGTAKDNAGNESTAGVTGINIDKTAPTVSLVGGPADGGAYYFGFVPAAPTCTASDALSGLDGSCSVSGYSTAVGWHTVTAGVSDKAGNTGSASATYAVLAWTLNGFYPPVDMNGVFNTVKNGSTVPLKFEVFAGPTELTDVSIVKSLTYTTVACNATAPSDEIETTATGGTSLRYDVTAGQFVYNWQTPRTPGACYRVTMTTQDGSPLVAFFKLK